MNRSRIFATSSHLKVCMSTKSKVPNYYETLEISQDSTQDDIKSAYYELSKKYHPDKNTSVGAKNKFHNVSDAYEVLSNFSKRKQYDRDLLARGDNAIRSPMYEPVKTDPLDDFHRSRMSTYDPNKNYTSNEAHFDFDEWSRAHYGTTLRRALKDKKAKILRENLRKQHQHDIEQNKVTSIVTFVTGTLILIALYLQSYFTRHRYDKNIIDEKGKS